MTPRRRILPVFVPHLGCPFQCVFCNQKRISGFCSQADSETVCSVIRNAGLEKGSTESYELAFYGGSFTAIPIERQQELLTAASDFVRRGGTLRLSTRPDAITEEGLALLKEHGVSTIEIGCQSMDEDVLRQSGRGHTAEDCVKAAGLIKEKGFQLITQMMTGLPGDSLAKAIDTAQQLIALRPDGVRIYPTVIVRDTPLYDLWLQGNYQEHTVNCAVEWCSVLLPMFQQSGIPVIRLGLNPTEELSGGQAVGGAYHPAFGELVRSRILLNHEIRLVESHHEEDEVTLLVHPSAVSAAVGQRKCNRLALQERFPGKRVMIHASESVPPGQVAVEINGRICYN